MMAPYLPFSSEKLWNFLGNDKSVHKSEWSDFMKELKLGKELEKPNPLFKKLDMKDFQAVSYTHLTLPTN